MAYNNKSYDEAEKNFIEQDNYYNVLNDEEFPQLEYNANNEFITSFGNKSKPKVKKIGNMKQLSEIVKERNAKKNKACEDSNQAFQNNNKCGELERFLNERHRKNIK
jgi:hypothetical protein